MRWISGAALAVGAALSGCTALASAPAPSADAQTGNCAITIEVRDTLDFGVREITVDSGCRSFRVTMKHLGAPPTSASGHMMGHNWVLTRTGDYTGAAIEGQMSGAENHYVKPGDTRVLAATQVVVGGEETSISFDPSILEPGGDYTFFCTFPGHFALMRGKLNVL